MQAYSRDIKPNIKTNKNIITLEKIFTFKEMILYLSFRNFSEVEMKHVCISLKFYKYKHNYIYNYTIIHSCDSNPGLMNNLILNMGKSNYIQSNHISSRF